jgi:hypothetical protein
VSRPVLARAFACFFVVLTCSIPGVAQWGLACVTSERTFLSVTCVQDPKGGCPGPAPMCTRRKVTDYSCDPIGIYCELTFTTLTGKVWNLTCVTSITGACVCPPSPNAGADFTYSGHKC